MTVQKMWQFSGMEVARITARGRTTIPKRIREEVGLLEGDVVAFDEDALQPRRGAVVLGQGG